MALARTYSVALVGVTGHVIEVEADIANGLVGMMLVGLPDTALREARDRIRAAIVNSGEDWPQRKITVGLSPASLPKRGSWFDLAIAIGVLAAAGTVPREAAAGVMFFGELGLDGRLRPVRGVLPAVAAAVSAGFGKVMVAEQNAAEAALVPGVRVIAASSLTGAAGWLRGLPGRDGGQPPPSSKAARNYLVARSGVPRAPSAAPSLTATQSPVAVPVEWSPRTPRWHLTSLSCSARRWPGEPPRYARRVDTICRCLGHLVPARQCWRNGYLPYCRASTPLPRWKSRPFTLWRERCPRGFRC